MAGRAAVGRVVQVATFEGSAVAETWRRTSALREAYMAETTSRLLDLARVGVGSRVLAVGVGTGGEALQAARRVGATGRVIATDLSSGMIAEAEKAAAEAGLKNIEFRVMDAQDLHFPARSFDAVTSRNVVMFIPDLHAALVGMRRLLRAAGRIGATVWSSRAANPRISDPLAAATALGVRPPATVTYRIALRLSRPAVLRTVLRAAGFREVEVERIALGARYGSLEEAVEASIVQAATQELLGLLGTDGEVRMRRSLQRRWARFVKRGRVVLPGEQLVVAGTA